MSFSWLHSYDLWRGKTCEVLSRGRGDLQLAFANAESYFDLEVRPSEGQVVGFVDAWQALGLPRAIPALPMNGVFANR